MQYPEAEHVFNRLKNLTVPGEPAAARAAQEGEGGRGRRFGRAAVARRRCSRRSWRRGFEDGGIGDAEHDYAKTQIRYAPGAASKGFTVALYLGTANVVEAANTTVELGSKKLSGDVIVVVGRDYPTLRGLLTKPIPTTTVPASTRRPPRRSGVRRRRRTTSTTTTTVTTPDTRYVPVARKGLRPLVGCP